MSLLLPLLWGLSAISAAQAASVPGDQPDLNQSVSSVSASSSTKQAAQPKATPLDKVVLKVGNEKITAGQLYQILNVAPDQAHKVVADTLRNLTNQYVLTLLLARQGLNDHLDSTPEFVKQLARQREQLLAEMEYQHLTESVTVSQQEISQYYASHQDEFEQTELRQVYVRKKPEGARAEAPGLRPQEARSTAETIAKQWAAGRNPRTIEQEIKDPNVGYFGESGEHTFFKQLPKEFQSVVYKLKPGEVSEPIETVQGYSVLQLVRRDHAELKEIANQIADKLRSQRIDAAINALKQKGNIWMDAEYFSDKTPAVPSSSSRR